MTGQHALRERAELLAELHDIVQAMKNLAFAQLQRVGRELPALAQARGAVLDALRRVDQFDPAVPPVAPTRAGPPPVTWLVIGAERGFCGAFNARLVAAVEELRRAQPDTRVLVASRRLIDLLGSEAAGLVALPGCAAIEEAQVALDSWLSAVADEAAQGRDVALLHTDATGLRRQPLLPTPELDAESTAPQPVGPVPMHYLPLPALRPSLRRQAVRLLIHAGLCASLQQENHWRLTQMQLAQDHLDKLGHALRRRRAALRQADITSELETLTSSLAGTGP
jgi:F-type H+-transporting ATPase subunit gamma